jgi:hypothetical protein
MGDNKQEYILTKDDVNSDYSDNNIKQSFTVKTMNTKRKIFKFNPLIKGFLFIKNKKKYDLLFLKINSNFVKNILKILPKKNENYLTFNK